MSEYAAMSDVRYLQADETGKYPRFRVDVEYNGMGAYVDLLVTEFVSWGEDGAPIEATDDDLGPRRYLGVSVKFDGSLNFWFGEGAEGEPYAGYLYLAGVGDLKAHARLLRELWELADEVGGFSERHGDLYEKFED